MKDLSISMQEESLPLNFTKKKKTAHAFKQQKLKAWQPILTPAFVIPTLIIIGVLFIAFGFYLYRISSKIQEYKVIYSDYCKNQTTCQVKFDNLSMTQPIYMYYELSNFYQNHRRFVKSRSDMQLRGSNVTNKNDLSACEPYLSFQNSNDPNLFYLPCGLIAKNLFSDVLMLKTESGRLVNVSKKGIAWESDVNEKFNNPSNTTPGIRTIPNFKDEDFINWMRIAATPTFRKLYRIIKENLNGTYFVEINNHYNISDFGSKGVIISEANFLGGKNNFLGITYIATGGICLTLGIIFLIIHCARAKEQSNYNGLDD